MRCDQLAKRNETIDRLRGFAMLWVIVVHTLYWGNFSSDSYYNLLKSFFLFEMPLFFFVTGASNSFSRTKGYFNFVYKRYKRILIPYWVFALICAGWTIGRIIRREGGIEIKTAAEILFSWLLPLDRQITSIQYLTWAVWFVPVYLCVVLIIPLLKKIRQTRVAFAFLAALIALFALICVFKLGWIQNVVFYSIWTYIGLFYSDIILWIKDLRFVYLLWIITFIGTAALIVLYNTGYPIDMQYNKFPPNIIFLIFSIVAMSLIILSIPHVDQIYDRICRINLVKRIFDLFSNRSLTIFLYQVFAFTVSIRLVYNILSGDTALLGIVKSVICFFITVPICALIALLLGSIEDLS